MNWPRIRGSRTAKFGVSHTRQSDWRGRQPIFLTQRPIARQAQGSGALVLSGRQEWRQAGRRGHLVHPQNSRTEASTRCRSPSWCFAPREGSSRCVLEGPSSENRLCARQAGQEVLDIWDDSRIPPDVACWQARSHLPRPGSSLSSLRCHPDLPDRPREATSWIGVADVRRPPPGACTGHERFAGNNPFSSTASAGRPTDGGRRRS